MKKYLVLLLCASGFSLAGEQPTVERVLADLEAYDAMVRHRIAEVKLPGSCSRNKLPALEEKLLDLQAKMCELEKLSPNIVLSIEELEELLFKKKGQ